MPHSLKPSTTAQHAPVLPFDALVGTAIVLLWSSGFVVPRFFAPYVEPMTFIAARNAGALLILALVALARRSPWPYRWADRIGLMWAGVLFQGFYLMALYWAIFHGLPVAIAALIGGLQPALTAVLASVMLGEMISGQQTMGLAVGLVGVGLVLSPKLASADVWTTLTLAFVSLGGVACGAYGSIHQKRIGRTGDPWSRTALLFGGAVIPPLIFAGVVEHQPITWTLDLVAVYMWAVVALSIGGTMGLLYLIQKGQAARAASLLYLVPPVSALMAYGAFGERVQAIQLAGFAVAAAGVYLVQAGQPAGER